MGKKLARPGRHVYCEGPNSTRRKGLGPTIRSEPKKDRGLKERNKRLKGEVGPAHATWGLPLSADLPLFR